jgi:ABC-type lipoprotein release transport system permease subunit
MVLSRFIASLLYAVQPHDPATFVAISGLIAAVALAACLVPARRAMRVDPARTLRAE